MSGVTVVTAEATDLVSATNIKRQLRIDASDTTHDALIAVVQASAIGIAKEYLNRSFINRTLKLSLDSIPYDNTALPDREGLSTGAYVTTRLRQISLPFSPLVSVSSVITYNDSDDATTMSTSKYYVDTASDIGRVVLRTGETWPEMLRVANSIEITYVAGYGTAVDDTPTAIRQGVLIMAAHLFENPDLNIKGESVSQIPALVNACWKPFRISRFGVGFG